MVYAMLLCVALTSGGAGAGETTSTAGASRASAESSKVAGTLRVPSAEIVEVPAMLIRIDEQVEVPAREAGVLAAVNVREGQMVEKGALIAQIEDDEARIAADRAKIEMEIAMANAENDVGVRFARKSREVVEAELRRSTEALDRYANSISASEMDHLRLLVDKSKVEIEQAEHEFKIAGFTRQIKVADCQAAQQAVSRRKISAPLVGEVVQVSRHRGEWVKPGDSVVRIVRLDHLRAEGFLSSRYLSPKLDGLKVKLIVELPGDPAAEFAGKIVFVDPEIDPVNAQVHVRVDVDNQGLRLRPGMRAKMQIEVPR
jgi:macrolide-specific efflux system membrane fusion protein